jgi:hypothetical protein
VAFAGHAVAVVEPSGQKELAGHKRHDAFARYVPAGQIGADEPARQEAPAGQVVQLVVPFDEAKEPAGHDVHAPAVPPKEYVPGKQMEHAPEFMVKPPVQDAHVPCVVPEQVAHPVEHAKRRFANGMVTWRCPGYAHWK